MKPLPVHPLLVHFPIAFFLLESWLVMLWNYKKNVQYRDFAWIVFRLGLLILFPTLLAGLYDARGLAAAWKHARLHFIFALSTTGFYCFRFVYWRTHPRDSEWAHWIQTLVGAALVIATGFFGGKLVYG